MCDYCRQTPCDHRCPNAPDPVPVCECDHCGKDIYEGDTIYKINDEVWCEECTDDARTYAEYQEEGPW